MLNLLIDFRRKESLIVMIIIRYILRIVKDSRKNTKTKMKWSIEVKSEMIKSVFLMLEKGFEPSNPKEPILSRSHLTTLLLQRICDIRIKF